MCLQTAVREAVVLHLDLIDDLKRALKAAEKAGA